MSQCNSWDILRNVMKLLTEEQFRAFNIEMIADYHGMKEMDFIMEVYPMDTPLMEESFYDIYKAWYVKTHNKLARALK